MRLRLPPSLTRPRGPPGIVDQPHISHATVSFRAAFALLANAGGIQAHIGARVAASITLPVPRFGFPLQPAECLARREQRLQPLASRLGGPLDGRFAEPQATQLAERDLA